MNTQPPAPGSEPTLSIADVERDTGLLKDTLRVWERRYGFPTPGRDAHGERRYDGAQLHKLRLVKRLLDAGHRPHQVVPLGTAELAELVQKIPAASTCQPMESAANPLVEEWLRGLKDNRTEVLRRSLEDHLLRHGLASTIEDFISPTSMAVGQAWLLGELSVFQEHLHTEIVQSVLREALAVLDKQTVPAPHAPRVLLTTLPDEQHAMGLLMAECFLALERCERFPLGACTPLTDVVNAARQLKVDVVALSFSAHQPPNDTVSGLRQLREQLPEDVALWVGGGAPVLYSRRLPKGVSALRKARELGPLVATWRRDRAGR